ncbi:hypothetical protein J3R83DRAFT_3808 [Lanmaoa asiatica]|nr:hypothetical protein J3R83DRAFT_3808 [Lanmaoa asiatica]
MANRRPVVIPANFGSADRFDRSIFPLSLSNSEALAQGEGFLDATVEELLSISSLCTNLSECKDFTKTTYFNRINAGENLTWKPYKDSEPIQRNRKFPSPKDILQRSQVTTTSELMIGSLDRESVSKSLGEEHSASAIPYARERVRNPIPSDEFDALLDEARVLLNVHEHEYDHLEETLQTHFITAP